MMKRLLLLFTVALLATAASATVLTGGSSSTVISSISVTGSVIGDTGIQSWTTGTMSGTYRVLVYADTSNSFCSGCVTFVFAVGNGASSNDAIGHVSDSSFTGFQTNVGVASNLTACGSSDVNPNQLNRNNFGVVTFDFTGGGVGPGSCTSALVIETDGTSFVGGNLSIQDGLNTTVASFAPAVPEPASLTLLVSGLALFGIRRFRK
jgi:hypothetical protein